MHEMSLAMALMDELERLLADFGPRSRVLSIELEVGALRAVVPDAMRFCFEVASRGTPAEDAYLRITEVPAQATCRGCGFAQALSSPDLACPRCAGILDLQGGRELVLRGVEIEDPEAEA